MTLFYAGNFSQSICNKPVKPVKTGNFSQTKNFLPFSASVQSLRQKFSFLFILKLPAKL
jgi:hypothetical protein